VCEQKHNNWAFERFTQSGPLALLPLASKDFSIPEEQGVYSLVWTCLSDNEQFISKLCDDKNFFLSILAEYAGSRHGKFIESSQRFKYPLQLSTSKQIYSHRSLVVGNAAQTLHPIAGQGFNLGLRDVQTLVDLLKTHPKESLGDWHFTNAYGQHRQSDRNLIIGATDALVHCFSNHYWPMVLGRNAGLLAMNKLGLIKQQFARRAMGYGT
jgi:2-octaprenyl-6-methoxyphenol hydroxylase